MLTLTEATTIKAELTAIADRQQELYVQAFDTPDMSSRRDRIVEIARLGAQYERLAEQVDKFHEAAIKTEKAAQELRKLRRRRYKAEIATAWLDQDGEHAETDERVKLVDLRQVFDLVDSRWEVDGAKLVGPERSQSGHPCRRVIYLTIGGKELSARRWARIREMLEGM